MKYSLDETGDVILRTIVFWGAGKIGKRMQNFWQQLGLQPDFFADNREELSGTVCQIGRAHV